MPESRVSLYNETDSLRQVMNKKYSLSRSRRNVGVLCRLRMTLLSRRFRRGLFWLAAAALCFYSCMPEERPVCAFRMLGETVEVQGRVAKLDVTSYGAKGRNDYRMEYTYQADGKPYTGVSAQSGLGWLENNPVTVLVSTEDPSCSCPEGPECLAQSALFTMISTALLLLWALLRLVQGFKATRRAIRVHLFGEIATAEITVSEEIIRHSVFGLGARTSIIHRWQITGKFSTTDGIPFIVQFWSKRPEDAKCGDTVSVIYDPEAPGNALCVDGLPRCIRDAIRQSAG